MNKQVWKAFAYFMAANFQAVLLIGFAFKLVEFLDQKYPQSFAWAFLVWPICVLVIAHSYYLMARQVVQLDKKKRDK